MAAPSTYVKNSTMGSLTIKDGSGTIVTLAVTYDRGDLSISGLGPKLNDVVTMQARGKHVSAAYGQRRYPEIKFSAWLTNVVGSTSSAPGSIVEMLAALGAYSANTPTTGTGRPNSVQLIWTIEGTNFGDGADETVTCNHVHPTFDLTEAIDGNSISISGTVHGSIVVANSGNTVTFDQIT